MDSSKNFTNNWKFWKNRNFQRWTNLFNYRIVWPKIHTKFRIPHLAYHRPNCFTISYKHGSTKSTSTFWNCQGYKQWWMRNTPMFYSSVTTWTFMIIWRKLFHKLTSLLKSRLPCMLRRFLNFLRKSLLICR